MEPSTGSKWLIGLAIACPGCAGGFFLALAATVGLSAAAIKGGIAFLVLAAIAGAWAANAWRRRNECEVPAAPARVRD